MKSFLKKTSLFLFPIIFLMVVIISMDIFKILGSYDNYYDDSSAELNRGVIVLNIYKEQRKKKKFNSFIFGNSRSQAYKTHAWKKHLPDDAIPFHFDASGEGLFGISNKIKYLDRIGDTINHALLIIDRYALINVNNIKKHISITPPELSRESSFEFYKTIFKQNFNPKFLRAYFDFAITKEYKSYMVGFLRDVKYRDYCDVETGDLYYGYDEWIKNDSLGFYSTSEKKERENKVGKPKFKSIVTYKEMQQLRVIREIFEKHNTSYEIILSPAYDKIPLEERQLELVNFVFGKNHVHNFSGENEFTTNKSNYYESVHYRPHLANELMDIVYSD